jgi:RNA polymerase-binding transcription factor DksA
MTAPLAVSQRSGGSVDSKLSISQAATLRSLLLAEAARQASSLALYATAMATSSPDTTGLARAMHALHMYRARAVLEEVEGALARVEAGTYGTCLVCGRPIPFEHLEAIPQARFCAACPAAAVPLADGSAGPRLGSGSGEQTGIPPPVRSPRHVDRSASQVWENARANPVAR